MVYCEFVKNYMKVEECKGERKYSNAGHSFCWHDEDISPAKGFYWFYEGPGYIIDIHDFYIEEEIVERNIYNMSDYVSLYTSYTISGNGERFNPYQTITAKTLFTLDLENIGDDYLFLLHENSYYLAVSIGFKKDLLEKHLSSLNIESKYFYSDLFLSNQTILTKSLEKVAMDILNCKMASPAAELFFNAKANEWISIVIDTYLNRKKYAFSPDDEKALEDVVRYLDDHYAMNVQQETLEKISRMSGTKLKNAFKEKYKQTITEYTQRKRMNVAEILLLNTNLPIKEIAESVGYSSHSKFSIYYKRYKGKSPSEIRKLRLNGPITIKCNHCT